MVVLHMVMATLLVHVLQTLQQIHLVNVPVIMDIASMLPKLLAFTRAHTITPLLQLLLVRSILTQMVHPAHVTMAIQ